MALKLTPGSVNRILNGKDVTGAVIQVLAYEKCSATEEVYSINVSDGDVNSSVFLHTQLNSLITNKKLETFTIIEVHKCVCVNLIDNKFSMLLNLTVLAPGVEVGKVLGNPGDPAKISRDAIKLTAAYTKCTSTQMTRITSEKQKLVSIPKLTVGSIKWIMDGDEVYAAVMQVLDCKKITLEDDLEKFWFRLLISDGVNYCSSAMLHTKFNSLIITKDLENFTIIRIDKCICLEKKRSCKIMIITDLTILIPGADVGSKLGNPVNYSTTSHLAEQ